MYWTARASALTGAMARTSLSHSTITRSRRVPLRVVHYLLDIPVDTQGPVAIEAQLNYRKFDTTYLQYLQGKQFTRNDLPVTVMASDQLLLPVQGQQDSPENQPVTGDQGCRALE